MGVQSEEPPVPILQEHWRVLVLPLGHLGWILLVVPLPPFPTNLIPKHSKSLWFGDRLMGLGDYVKSAFIAGVTGGFKC